MLQNDEISLVVQRLLVFLSPVIGAAYYLPENSGNFGRNVNSKTISAQSNGKLSK